MQFAEVPEHRPIISGIHSHYYIGSSLRANCTSRNSKPAANLTWTINNKPVSFSVKQIKIPQNYT